MNNSKKDIDDTFDTLISKVQSHLNDWKNKGGGTTGHAIGSVMEKLKTLKEFYKNSC